MCKGLIGTVFLLLVISSIEAQETQSINISKFSVNSSIRAIEVVNDDEVWFAGSNGLYGHTKNGGDNWVIDSMSHPLVPELQFRSIAVTNKAVFILSIGSPALLFKISKDGKDWQIVYQEDHAKAFYDAMSFWDDRNGIAMGDPTDECLSIIITNDGGNSWKKVPCEKLPDATDGEAAFAASNSNIALYGNHAWIVTGAADARVFHSADKGNSWEVFETPIVKGGQMTGIYTVDFFDDLNGILFGGDWNDMERNTKNKAITKDGGKTWNLTSNGLLPGYRSCVQYDPTGNGLRLIAVGIPGISTSKDGGMSWNNVSDESYYTARYSPSGKTLWLAGKNVIAKLPLE